MKDEIDANVIDTNTLFEKAFRGDTDAQDEIKTQFTNMNNFLGEAVPILTRMAVNDHTLKIEGHYEGLAGEAAVGVNQVRDRVNHIAGSIVKIGEGDISEYEEYKKIGRRSENDTIVPGFIQCLGALRGLIADANMLSKAAVEGKLDTRADATKHKGDYRKIVEGVNETLDAVIGPLNVAAEYVDRISKGEIPAKITDKYNGDFNEIKNNLNNCIDAINGLVADANMLSKAAVEGKLDTRADATKHQGDYRKIVQGVDDCLDAVIGPLNVAAEYVDRISKGDIPPKITEKYNGDFNEIKNNLNNCVDIMNGLLSETDVLIQATKDGKLDTRGNAQKFPGGWGKLVGGVNELIDAFVHPINVTAEYVDRFSKGEIPQKITDKYNGDFNEIKNCLNACIDGLQGLVEANKVLGRMAVNDHSKGVEGDYVGLFAEVKVHVNEVRDRLRGVTKQINEIAIGDVKELDELKRVGKRSEEDHLLPAIINCLEVVDRLIKDTAVLAKAAEEGRLDTRADVSRHVGEYKTIVQGINNTLDNVIGPLNVAAEYVDRISKGDIPPKITDKYNGDFNEIKNNLNQCIDVMNGLLQETDVLIQATKQGKLDTRGNSQKFPGGWGKLVAGVNDLVDAFVHPINVTAEYVDRISKGDIPPKITDTYQGDFNEIKNNLNQCIEVMNGLLQETDLLIQATKDGKLDTRGNSQKFPGGWGKLVGGVNELVDAFVHPINVTSEYVDRISKGDIPPKITDTYKGDFNEIKNNLNQCIEVMNGLLQETDVLIQATKEGKLDTRGNSQKFPGGWGKLVAGVNDLIDAFVHPINVTAEYVDRISKGDIPPKITDKYNGDFNEIKNNLNQCIEVMNGLLQETEALIKATKEGKLQTRGNAQKFPGGWGTLVGGVNDLIEAFVHPINVTADYVDRISKGNLPPKITDTYLGDFNQIKNNLNNCIDNINALVGDANILAKAAVEGKLDTRADATKHEGDYRKIVEGVNSTLDSVIGPLNVAAEYVDRISKGEIPAKITDNYNGDFNEIKNTLNACIDAINGLVADANMLAKAAVEGKLKTRADATKHQGDYRKIVEGVNATLDSVINPVNEALRMSIEFSKCNFAARVDENLHVEGDFIKFKDALNSIGIEVSKAVNIINQQVMELASNAEEANASVEEVSSGAEQIAKNAAGVSTNAERGNEGIAQVLRAMEDLNQTVTDVAQKAEKVSQLTEDANQLSTKGTGLAEQAERGMQSITTSSNEVDKIIFDIKAEMDKIGKIVGLISDLANQTNLLALNAAIEAARAGEAGRGFAVVATEVKSLAQESRASAENIAEMIGTLQKKSMAAGEAVASSNREVKAGSEALSQTLRAFKDIARSIEDISKNVVEVASVSEEQAATVEEVTASVNEVHGMVQATSKDAMDAAAASEEASASIDQISKVIGGVNSIVDKVSKEMAKFRV